MAFEDEDDGTADEGDEGRGGIGLRSSTVLSRGVEAARRREARDRGFAGGGVSIDWESEGV